MQQQLLVMFVLIDGTIMISESVDTNNKVFLLSNLVRLILPLRSHGGRRLPKRRVCARIKTCCQ